jgi:hypothetical protein
MSLIYSIPAGRGAMAVFCPKCSVYVGTMTLEEIGELSRANLEAYCFDCFGDPDRIPKQLYYAEDVFLLGMGDKSFLAHWSLGGMPSDQESLGLAPISNAAWYALKTGDIRVLSVPTSLSSRPKVITIDVNLDEKEADADRLERWANAAMADMFEADNG